MQKLTIKSRQALLTTCNSPFKRKPLNRKSQILTNDWLNRSLLKQSLIPSNQLCTNLLRLRPDRSKIPFAVSDWVRTSDSSKNSWSTNKNYLNAGTKFHSSGISSQHGTFLEVLWQLKPKQLDSFHALNRVVIQSPTHRKILCAKASSNKHKPWSSEWVRNIIVKPPRFLPRTNKVRMVK